MAKDDNEGLLSKVVRFVTNPTTNWADLDQQEASRESGYSKQMLKEMIERKRRNDFVRKREFDMLRKMRRSELMAGQDPAARPSFFQSSLPSRPDDRASTLKKIDEIEAQMSMQWWKNKQGDAGSRIGSSTNFPVGGAVPGATAAKPAAAVDPASGNYIRTEPQGLSPRAEPAEEDVPLPLMDFHTSTARMPLEPAPAPAAPQRPAAPPPGQLFRGTRPAEESRLSSMPTSALAAAGPDSTPSSGFSASKMAAIEVDDFASDPEIEEASIRFANGDDAGAESGLLEVLKPGASRAQHDETWNTLFDLYRATGQQERFEAAAIDYANRFNRSAPPWFAIREATARRADAAASGQPQSADWTCPSVLGIQTLAALNAALGRAAQPWRLNWTKLTTIDAAAVEPLTKLFSQWAGSKVQIRFMAADHLERVLREKAPTGDKSVPMPWWSLRLEALRVMHRPDEFELAALDYCVTYEVSPPSWETARCDYKPLQDDGSTQLGHLSPQDGFRDSMSSGIQTSYGDTQLQGLPSVPAANVARADLAGDVRGDASASLEQLDAKLAGTDHMIVSCARLVRVDFTAAGTLLNWVTARQAEGRSIEFTDAHRLVACFLNVIGITEHARVTTRVD